jgi:hypothetical protein
VSTDHPTVRQAAGSYSRRRHLHGEDHPSTRDARRDLAAANIEQAIRRNLDGAPALTDAQASRLTVLIVRGGQR